VEIQTSVFRMRTSLFNCKSFCLFSFFRKLLELVTYQNQNSYGLLLSYSTLCSKDRGNNGIKKYGVIWKFIVVIHFNPSILIICKNGLLNPLLRLFYIYLNPFLRTIIFNTNILMNFELSISTFTKKIMHQIIYSKKWEEVLFWKTEVCITTGHSFPFSKKVREL